MHTHNIPDMSCGHCARTVEKAVKSVDLYAKVAINVAEKTASIDSQIAVMAFVAAIENAGYKAQTNSPNDCPAYPVD